MSLEEPAVFSDEHAPDVVAIDGIADKFLDPSVRKSVEVDLELVEQRKP